MATSLRHRARWWRMALMSLSASRQTTRSSWRKTRIITKRIRLRSIRSTGFHSKIAPAACVVSKPRKFRFVLTFLLSRWITWRRTSATNSAWHLISAFIICQSKARLPTASWRTLAFVRLFPWQLIVTLLQSRFGKAPCCRAILWFLRASIITSRTRQSSTIPMICLIVKTRPRNSWKKRALNQTRCRSNCSTTHLKTIRIRWRQLPTNLAISAWKRHSTKPKAPLTSTSCAKMVHLI